MMFHIIYDNISIQCKRPMSDNSHSIFKYPIYGLGPISDPTQDLESIRRFQTNEFLVYSQIPQETILTNISRTSKSYVFRVNVILHVCVYVCLCVCERLCVLRRTRGCYTLWETKTPTKYLFLYVLGGKEFIEYDIRKPFHI